MTLNMKCPTPVLINTCGTQRGLLCELSRAQVESTDKVPEKVLGSLGQFQEIQELNCELNQNCVQDSTEMIPV